MARRVRRGDIWTVAGDQGYAGKPRPVVVVQDDRFDATGSITICAFTTDETEAPLMRLLVKPNARNGLRAGCRQILRVQSGMRAENRFTLFPHPALMVDKITTVPKSKVGAHVGRLDDEDILRLNRAILVFLGLAVSARAQRDA